MLGGIAGMLAGRAGVPCVHSRPGLHPRRSVDHVERLLVHVVAPFTPLIERLFDRIRDPFLLTQEGVVRRHRLAILPHLLRLARDRAHPGIAVRGELVRHAERMQTRQMLRQLGRDACPDPRLHKAPVEAQVDLRDLRNRGKAPVALEVGPAQSPEHRSTLRFSSDST